MPESMKNRDLYPIGTRVHIAQDKFVSRIGTIVEYAADNERMFVHWDDDYIVDDVPRIVGPFMPMELKEIR